MLSVPRDMLMVLSAEHAERPPCDVISRVPEMVTWLSRQIITDIILFNF